MKTRLYAALAMLTLVTFLAIALQPVIAYADNGNGTKEQAPLAEEVPVPFVGGLPMMGNDYVWFGRNLELDDHKVANDLIAAGQVVDVSNCNAGGSIRAAAQVISIEGSTARQSITVAAQDVRITNTKANAIAAAGATVTVSGSCKELTAYAQKVVIDGTVAGDVVVGAETVEIGPNARIKGTLKVSAAQEPILKDGAKVGKVEFSQVETDTTNELTDTVEVLGGVFHGLAMIAGIFGTIIVAILAEWLFRRHTATAAEMIRTRTGATIGSGVIGTFALPIAIVVLLLLVITIPVSIALIFVLVAMAMVSAGFMGASVFKIAFPKLGRYVCALAGGTIMGVASVLPIVGTLVDVVAFVYLLGYVLQSIYLGMRLEKAEDKTPVLPE